MHRALTPHIRGTDGPERFKDYFYSSTCVTLSQLALNLSSLATCVFQFH